MYLNSVGDHVSCLVFPSWATGTQEGCNYGRAAGNFQNLTLTGMQHMHQNFQFHQVKMFEDVVMGIFIEEPGLVTCREQLKTPLIFSQNQANPRNSLLNGFSFLTVFHAPLHFIQSDITWLNPFCSSRKESFKFTSFLLVLLQTSKASRGSTGEISSCFDVNVSIDKDYLWLYI